MWFDAAMSILIFNTGTRICDKLIVRCQTNHGVKRVRLVPINDYGDKMILGIGKSRLDIFIPFPESVLKFAVRGIFSKWPAVCPTCQFAI